MGLEALIPIAFIGGATVLLMVAKIILGTLKAQENGVFDKEILIASLKRYGKLLIASAFIFGAGILGDAYLQVDGEQLLTLTNVVSTGLAFYGYTLGMDVVNKFMVITGMKQETKEGE